MYVLETTGKNYIAAMAFFDRFIDPITFVPPTFGKKLDIRLARVVSGDSKNYSFTAMTFSSREYAESEAKRISGILKEENPEKYPDGIEFRVMELWKIMDPDKIQCELKLLAIQNGF